MELNYVVREIVRKSGRTTSRTHRHTDKLLRLVQSKSFGRTFGRSPRQHLRLDQS